MGFSFGEEDKRKFQRACRKDVLDEEYNKIYLDCVVKLSVEAFGYGQKVEKATMERIMKQSRDIATMHYDARKEKLETDAPI